MVPACYDDIREFVTQALRQRESADVPEFLKPSEYWKFFASHFEYVRSLLDCELQHIRRHTYHLTGDDYIRYLLHGRSFPERVRNEYEELSRGIPGLRADEGPTGIGLDLDGVRVSVDLLRYLQVLRDLIDSGVLQAQGPQRILEIGGGYGGLASLLVQYNPAISYIIVDLEETLFFQAVHLANRFGLDAISLCDEELPRSEQLQPSRFYLVPQSRSAAVCGLSVDLVINQQSMQEMNERQVMYYCDLIHQVAQYFYSCNMAQHPQTVVERMGIVRDLPELFEGRFPRTVWKPRNRRTRSKIFNKLLGRRRRLSDHALPRAVYACAAAAMSGAGDSPAVDSQSESMRNVA